MIIIASKYVDISAIIQVIGSCFLQPQLLDYTDKYTITEDDFPDKFHRVIFGTIYKLHELGAEKITLEGIQDYLSSRPNSLLVYQNGKGEEWITKAKESATPNAFDYYYSRLKKFSLLRAFDNYGIDVSFIYDADSLLDVKKKQLQEDQLDNYKLEEIVHKVDQRIEDIKVHYVSNVGGRARLAGDGLLDLVQDLKRTPEVGPPLFGPLINTVTRGARLGKFYLRSASSGLGKTRTMVADWAYIACDRMYDENFGWIRIGKKTPALYVCVEQDLDEIQTMLLAFISNVDEEHILYGKYEPGEEERVIEAAKIIAESPLYFEYLPDFSLKDVEDVIVRNIRDHETNYIFEDYILTSMKILEEISSRSGGVKLREDNVLFLLSARLKDIAQIYNVFIMSSTQLSSNFNAVDAVPDQTMLRGSRAIADRIDAGMIMLRVNENDIKALTPILETNTFQVPDIKISVYKNRRGRWKGVYLWAKADLKVCKINPMFCTDWSYELQQIDDIHILFEDRESAFA